MYRVTIIMSVSLLLFLVSMNVRLFYNFFGCFPLIILYSFAVRTTYIYTLLIRCHYKFNSICFTFLSLLYSMSCIVID